MTKIIAKLWNGDIKPVEDTGVDTPEMRELSRLMEHNIGALKKTLNESEKELLEKYNNCAVDYIYAANEVAFCDGFCLGARLTAEALLGAEQLSTEG